MSGPVIEVPPTSRKILRAYAWQLRTKCALTDPWFPVRDFLEFFLPIMMSGFVYDVGTHQQMGKAHGHTWPDAKWIRLREDIYRRAHDHCGRDRGTVAHEVGHLLLHAGLPHARRVDESEIPRFRSSEWQAKCFAGELLFPAHMAPDYPAAASAAEVFGISEDSANVQLAAYKKDGLI